MSDDPILSARDLDKRHGERVGCAQVSFGLWPGEMLAVVGEPGSGKTTLLNGVAGRRRPTAGTVRCRMRDGMVRNLAPRPCLAFMEGRPADSTARCRRACSTSCAA